MSIFSVLKLNLIAEAARRTFYKECMKVIEASDVIIQVLDARDPIGTRCVEVERMVHEAGPSKRIVLVLNKIGKTFRLYSCSPRQLI